MILGNKEYVVVLRAFKKGIALHTIFYKYEVKDIKDFGEINRLVVVSKEELELSKVLISHLKKKAFRWKSLNIQKL
jgi:non-homologous end joining protein Ku